MAAAISCISSNRWPDTAELETVFDALTLFGLIAVSLMLLFYALESRGPGFVLAFAAACVLASAYGFLQGAWPFGAAPLVAQARGGLRELPRRPGIAGAEP
jgi:hypothetical protein